jgi:hypothetical protein
VPRACYLNRVRGVLSRLLVVSVLCMSARPVRAQDAEPSSEQRIRTLDAYLHDIQRPTRVYWGVWLSILASLAVVQTTLAVVSDAGSIDRATFATGAGLSVAGVVALFAFPHPGLYASRRFRALPEGNEQEKLAKIAAGEALLHGEARSVARARSYFMHIVSGALGVGMTLGLGFTHRDQWLRAVGSGVGAAAMVEARVWTRPARVLDYERRYREDATRVQLSMLPSIARRSLGMSLQLRF